jgi:CRISPR system Cascade subunit CasD
MRDYLLIKLQGPMQAWGKESFEGLRPSELFPGRSALLGLLGACLGIDRIDQKRQEELAASVWFAVRIDPVFDKDTGKPIATQKMTDYHTVKDAREDYRGLKSHDTIQTWREYWQDACYTVAIWATVDAPIALDDIEKALNRPLYTPVLGRRSCPLARPLFHTRLSAESALLALAQSSETCGTIYSEEESDGAILIKKRDVPIIRQPRQFASRFLYVTASQGVQHVSE